MKVREGVFSIGLHATADFLQIPIDDPIAADLTRKTPLPTDPLAIDMILAFELRAVSFDPR
jgi:hypothetical protein